MKRAAIAGLLILILFAAGEAPRLVVIVEDDHGSTFELAARPVRCSDTSVHIEASFGERADCIDMCARRSNAEGHYTIHTGVVPALTCLGPRGATHIPGTGSLESVPVTFCADEACTRMLDYCDCTPPNLSVPQSDRWYSEPFTIEAVARDNYNMSRIESVATEPCTGPECTKTITVPIGTICTQTGAGTCAVYVNATDLWEHTAHTVIRTNVDLNAPIARHEWIGSGPYHKDRVRVRFEAHEPTPDESGVSAIWVEKRTENGCSEPGPNYTRHENPAALSFEDPGNGIALCYYATDRAIPANTGDVQRTQTRYADTTPPRLEITPSGWHAQNVQVQVTCVDDRSGCTSYGLVLTNDSCPIAADPSYSPSPVRTQCENGSVCSYRACAWGADGVGHETFVERDLSIDRSPPSVEVLSDDPNMLELLISDAGSGLSRCSITTSTNETIACEVEGTITSLSLPLICPDACTYTISVEDVAGNEAVIEHTR